MTLSIVLYIMLFAVLFVLTFTYREAKKHKTSAIEEFIGICNIALDRTIRKKANIKKIIQLFSQKGEISNHDIRKFLRVSSRTVVRYMDELEKRGKVEQIGKIGHYVTYRLK